MENPREVTEFLKQWETSFLDCFEQLPKHFHNVTHKEYKMDNDPWIYQSINDPE